ncbi:hypothetical protein GCM10009804_27630 [Kribbella hippodromi]|uniref:N-acyltransferase N-terminal domain-containing protein n=1 Tax=Kribbella hippodromi TaxID=434347 RepID=A0ABN2D419_9ACTN
MDVLRVDARSAAERLGFPERDRNRLQEVDHELRLPDNAEELLAYCGVQAADRQQMLAARPDPERDPDWWAITSALAGELARDLGQALHRPGSRPGLRCRRMHQLSDCSPARGRCWPMCPVYSNYMRSGAYRSQSPWPQSPHWANSWKRTDGSMAVLEPAC